MTRIHCSGISWLVKVSLVLFRSLSLDKNSFPFLSAFLYTIRIQEQDSHQAGVRQTLPGMLRSSIHDLLTWNPSRPSVRPLFFLPLSSGVEHPSPHAIAIRKLYQSNPRTLRFTTPNSNSSQDWLLQSEGFWL